MKKIISLLLFLLLCFGYSSCTVLQKEISSSLSSDLNETSQSYDVKYPVTIIDAAGRNVVIEKEPQKIISGYYISTSMLIALGQDSKLVGVEAKADSRNIYYLASPQILNLPSVGTAKSFDIELSLSLNPDLVILPIKLVEYANTLQKVGINVITVNPETEDDILDTVLILGKACGTEKGTDIVKSYNDIKNEIKNALKEISPLRIYMAGNSSYLKTAGKNMYQNVFIENAGGINVASEIDDNYWAEISYEQLLKFDPDAIVMASNSEYKEKDIVSDSILSNMRCIKNGNVISIPSDIESWDSPVPGSILGCCYVASCLYPNLYSKEKYMENVKEFYGTFYNICAFDDILY